jgi:hypothetical protein
VYCKPFGIFKANKLAATHKMSNSKNALKSPSRDAEKASMRPPDDVKALLSSAEKTIADVGRAPIMKSHKERPYPTFDHSELDL